MLELCMAKFKNLGVTQTCRFCAQPFVREPRWLTYPLTFCSGACYAKFRRRRKNPAAFLERRCAECAARYTPSVKSHSKQRCCSSACGKKLYYREHKKQEDVRVAAWQKRNRHRTREYVRASMAKRPEYYRKVKALCQRRRDNAMTGIHTAEQWGHLLKQYDYRCVRCGHADVELTEDHVVPLSRGGTDDIGNIQPLCRSCNSSKFTQSVDYRILHPQSLFA